MYIYQILVFIFISYAFYNSRIMINEILKPII